MGNIKKMGWKIEFPDGMYGFIADGETVPFYVKLTAERLYLDENNVVHKWDKKLSYKEE